MSAPAFLLSAAAVPVFAGLATEPLISLDVRQMYDAFPLWVLVVDYLLGVVMWTLIGRFGMGLFLPEDSNFFFMRFFVRATNPLLRLFAPVTPGFLVPPLVPLFVAWFFFMIRFYLMPWLLGYSVMGMLSFPLESEIAHSIARLIGTFVN